MAPQVTSRLRRTRTLKAALIEHATTAPRDEIGHPREVRLVRPNGIGLAVPGFSRACLIRLIDYPEMPLRTSTREVIKNGRSALLVRTEFPVEDRMTSVAYKRVRRRTWLKKLTGWLRPQRAVRTWHLGHALLERGIATARPLAAILPRQPGLRFSTFLVQEWIEGALNLQKYGHWLEGIQPQARIEKTRNAARSLGRLLGHMHAQNVSHRDLKPGNLLLVDHGRTVTAYVIDLDGAAIRRRLSKRERLKNLSRLVIGLEKLPELQLTVLLRFLNAYLATAGDAGGEWKRTWRELEKVSAARRGKKRRRLH